VSSALSIKSAVRRQAVIDAAIELYLSQGFASTTMDMIADRSGVPRRTIFREFATKEDIVLAWTMATGPALVERLNAKRSKADPISAATEAVLAHIHAYRDFQPLSLKVSRLIEDTPSLKSRAHEKYQIWEDMMATAITSHGGAPLAAAMAAAVAIGGLRIAARQWSIEQGKRSISDLTISTYAALSRPTNSKECT